MPLPPEKELGRCCDLCMKRFSYTHLIAFGYPKKYICRPCLKQIPDAHDNGKTRRDIETGINRIVRAAVADRVDVQTISETVSDLIRAVGGRKRLAEKFAENFHEVTEGGHNRAALDYFRTIFELVRAANEEHREELDLDTATPEELESAIEKYMLKVVGADEDGGDQQADQAAG